VSRTVLTAFYDLAIGPASYDFIVFLIQAETQRRILRADKLHVVFVPDKNTKFRSKPSVYSHDEAEWRFSNICIPACALVGATHSAAVDWSHANSMAGMYQWPTDWGRQSLGRRSHLIGGVIHDHLNRAVNPCDFLRASNTALAVMQQQFHDYKTRANAKGIVTMTYRNTGYMSGRDVDGGEWAHAANAIIDAGFAVYAISDVASTLRSGIGFCELNLDLRMAAYQLADLNIVANTGPASLCWFSKTPYLMFDAGVGDTRAEWENLFVKQGLPFGETWDWAFPGQKIVYVRSTSENILKEFRAWASATK
jgi:hypothetical protein